MSKKWNEDDEQYVLKELKRYGVKDVKVSSGATQEPPFGTSEYLDYLDKYAREITLGCPQAPKIIGYDNRFILDRKEKKRTFYKNIRTVLKKLFFETAEKEEAKRIKSERETL